MENEPINPEPEKATDQELAAFLIKHINDPCEVEIEPGVVENIRSFYLRLAREQILKMTDPKAIDLLNRTIEIYQ